MSSEVQRVCDEVTEIRCNIVPFAKCQMFMEVKPYKTYEMVPQEVYKRKTCSEGVQAGPASG